MSRTNQPPAQRAGRPKSEQKTADIIEAAGNLFLERGFQKASMDAISQLANVSKQTVYGHFDNKEELFRACIERKITTYGFKPEAASHHWGDSAGEHEDAVSGQATGSNDEDIAQLLMRTVTNFTRLLLDPEVVAMYRAVMAEAHANPRVARLFFESGPRNTRTFVQTFLQQQVELGRLQIADDRLDHAATQLLSSSIGMFQLRMLLALENAIDDRELDQHCARVVEDFLVLYGAHQVCTQDGE